jgi:flavin reductase (DIM6/NTAB) family NADH-FMN oxidoreductase RutF
MDAPADTLSPRQLYKLMTGTIVPRPIAWVSTRSRDGVANLAPFSYFNGVASDPPTLMFSCGKRSAERDKDTLTNVLETRAFVVNLVTFELAEAMNLSAIDAPPEHDEFEIAGVSAAPAQAVAAPRVAESPVHFECVLAGTFEAGSNVAVFGRIVHLHIDERVLLENDRIDMAALDPVGRLAGNRYLRLGETFEMTRPAYNDWVVGDPSQG